MFVLARIRETVKLSPRKMVSVGLVAAIKHALGAKYCNRVLPGAGLCVAVHDVLEAGEPIVHQGHQQDASPHVQVVFRIVIFRPLPGTILEGTIRSSNIDGIRVSLGFFDDVLVPPSLMHTDSTVFDGAEQVWSWNYNDTRLFLDAGEAIRIRVTSEIFTESPPILKNALMNLNSNSEVAPPLPAPPMASLKSDPGRQALSSPAPPDDKIVPQVTPYQIIGSIAEDGLGLTRWWQ